MRHEYDKFNVRDDEEEAGTGDGVTEEETDDEEASDWEGDEDEEL